MTDLCAYQGEPGAFSEQAARRLVGAAVHLLPCADFPALFAAVDQLRVRWAVVPVENTLAGPVIECQEWLKRARIKTVGELNLPIRLELIARAGAKLVDIHRAYSHPVALRQCRKFFAQHPRLSAVAAHDTAGAVREVMQGQRRDEAAIAAAHCAEIYGGRVLVDDIGDHTENYTRFLLIQSA